jgi:transcriptional regulator (arsR family)
MRFEMSQKTMNLLKESIPKFEMLRDPRRQEILILLFDHKDLTVNEVAKKMTLSRPTVSHHLKLLLQAGLVTVTQKGKERYYDVSFDQAITILESLLASLKKDVSERNS